MRKSSRHPKPRKVGIVWTFDIFSLTNVNSSLNLEGMVIYKLSCCFKMDKMYTSDDTPVEMV